MKQQSVKRNKRVDLRVSQDELTHLQNLAQVAAVNMSDLLRLSLFAKHDNGEIIEPGRAVLIEGMMELTEIASVLRSISRQQKMGIIQVNSDLLNDTLIRLGLLSSKLINHLENGGHGKK